MLANATQKSYYQNTRDRKQLLEERLGLGEHTISPTPGMGGMRSRLARVTTFQTFMLVALLAADLAGLATSLVKAFPSEETPTVVVAVQVEPVRPTRSAKPIPLVASAAGRVEATSSSDAGRTAELRLRPGQYQIAAWTGRLCERTVDITSAPLQGVHLRCR